MLFSCVKVGATKALRYILVIIAMLCWTTVNDDLLSEIRIARDLNRSKLFVKCYNVGLFFVFSGV